MTLEEFLAEARSILPGERVNVSKQVGENYSGIWAIGYLVCDGGFDRYRCIASHNDPVAALEAARNWANVHTDRKAERVAELKAELAKLEGE